MVGRAADNNDHSDGGFDSLEHPGGLSSLRRVRHLARASETVIPETDAALRRIRERLNDGDESPGRTSRVRRPSTLASGVVAMCALGVFAADAELQLPGSRRGCRS